MIMPLLLECGHVEWIESCVSVPAETEGEYHAECRDCNEASRSITQTYQNRIALCRQLQEPDLCRPPLRGHISGI